MNSETLLEAQNAFVRFKGFYEGFYHGFYRNEKMDDDKSMALCLSDESYESLDIIAEAFDLMEVDDWSKSMQGFTAIVRLIIDNMGACKFTSIFLDTTTFCFINNCSWFIMISNFSINWAEIIFAFNMIWTTIVSSEYNEYTFEDCYKFYFSAGDNTALMLDDIIGFRPADGYNYDPNENDFAED